MKRNIPIFGLVVLLPLGCGVCFSVGTNAGEIQILTCGDYRPGEVDSASGDEWLCVHYPADKKDESEVKQCPVTVRSFGDEVQVLAGYGTWPMFLVRGTSLIKPGMARTISGGASMWPGAGLSSPTSLLRMGSIDLEFGEQGFKLSVESQGDGRCLLKLTDGTATQTLKSFEQCGGIGEGAAVWVNRGEMIDLYWAGDLDHDNRLDLLVSWADVAGRGEQTLYLTSTARRDELIGLAAVLSMAGTWPEGVVGFTDPE